ncbi:unnamed protein product [Symbiodinium sp. CCMP2592]|nr:unnamed protein product [Symbiodinium sp. CCMP2592]
MARPCGLPRAARHVEERRHALHPSLPLALGGDVHAAFLGHPGRGSAGLVCQFLVVAHTQRQGHGRLELPERV